MFTVGTLQKKVYMGGYTLLELLVVIAIIAIVLGIPFFSMLSERQKTILDIGEATVLQALITARSRSQSGVDGVGHGVCLRLNEAVVYAQGACANCDTCNGEIYPLPPGTILTVGQVEFEKISGESSPQAITVTRQGDSRVVTISDHGFIE